MTQEEALDAEMRYVASKAAPLPVPAPFAVAESTATASALAEGHSSPVAESPTPPLRDVQDEDIEFLEERQVVAKKGPGGTWTKQCLISLRKQRLAHGVKISWPEVQKIMARQWPNDVWHLEVGKMSLGSVSTDRMTRHSSAPTAYQGSLVSRARLPGRPRAPQRQASSPAVRHQAWLSGCRGHASGTLGKRCRVRQ